jgi:hypothetical protein
VLRSQWDRQGHCVIWLRLVGGKARRSIDLGTTHSAVPARLLRECCQSIGCRFESCPRSERSNDPSASRFQVAARPDLGLEIVECPGEALALSFGDGTRL